MKAKQSFFSTLLIKTDKQQLLFSLGVNVTKMWDKFVWPSHLRGSDEKTNKFLEPAANIINNQDRQSKQANEKSLSADILHNTLRGHLPF